MSSPASDLPNRSLAPTPGPGPYPSRTRVDAVKVAPLTAGFWFLKILTTGTGETASDFLARTPVPEVAVALTGIVLAVLLTAQLRASRYRPWLYWGVVAAVGVFGTMVADVLHFVVGVSFVVTAVAFAVIVAALLALWYRVEGTLAIHSITTRRREVFYWCTVVATFALGTAAGDLTATTLGLGYLASAVLFAVAIAVPAAAHRWGRLDPVLAFWAAYVLTRPLGASIADWLAIDSERGGLGLGTGPVSVVLTVVIVLAVALTARRARAR
jgi:uncharacterized membrane-anchored protein